MKPKRNGRRAHALRYRWAIVVLVGAACLCGAQGASALGQLEFGGCVSNDGSAATCADLPGIPMGGPQALTTSPEGDQVYVAAGSANSISVFGRQSAGQIAFEGCVSSDGSSGTCADAPGRVLDGAVDLAVSPDGQSLYAATFSSQTLVGFDRREGGQIAYDACFGNDTTGGLCSDLPGAPLSRFTAVTVSPDGKSVYAAGLSTVTAFDRDAGGNLTYAGCLSDDGSGGLCADASGQPLGSTERLRVSPDGNQLYVASLGSITVLNRDADGRLSFGGCVSDNGVTGCANPPGNLISGVDDVELSPDGNQLYSSAFNGRAVLVYGRAAGGQISYQGCVSETGSGGQCGDLPDGVMTQPESLAISADGGSVYVPDSFGRSVTVLDRAPSGQLTFGGCVSDDGTGGKCADVPGETMAGVADVALSPDDRSVYVSQFGADAVDHFFRKSRPDTTIDSGPEEDEAIADATPRFTFSADQAGATFECAVDGGQFGPCASGADVSQLADGRHRFAVRAVTAGDADATPAERRFSVDTTGPVARITKAPKRKVRTAKRRAKVQVAFGSDEPEARFECSLDGGAFEPCSSPRTLRVRRGRHQFAVRAIDPLGNAGPIAATRVRVVSAR